MGRNRLMLRIEDMLREASAVGFQVEPFEKVTRLFQLLESFRSHPFLKDRLALKGGTALNLFVFDVPRLSVDIDLNYTGAADRETMLAERPKIEQAVQAVCGRLGIQVHRTPSEHAGGKWRLSYTSASGRSGNIEVDLNFLFRIPLWPIVHLDSRPLGSFSAKAIPVLDVHELAAGKLAALFGRNACRDLFDADRLLQTVKLNREKLRLAFVVYGGVNRKDWRTIAIEDIKVDARDVERQLIPMLRADFAPARADISSWSKSLLNDCRDRLSSFLPLQPPEIDFLTRLNDHGEIVPELLSRDRGMQAVIRSHPGLKWKAQNVLEFHGLGVRASDRTSKGEEETEP
jgi:predicted nucleotidyltransferase component of viral defense system